jgi:hypothetical protein
MLSLLGGYWYGVRQTDPRVVALYRAHYSSAKKASSIYRRHGIAGPSDTVTLLTVDGRALWLSQKNTVRDDGQEGINCAVFRNEGEVLSSLLVQEATALVESMWPERQFTYVDPRKTRHKRDPGRCFLRAGWRYADPKYSKGGLVILEWLPVWR